MNENKSVQEKIIQKLQLKSQQLGVSKLSYNKLEEMTNVKKTPKSELLTQKEILAIKQYFQKDEKKVSSILNTLVEEKDVNQLLNQLECKNQVDAGLLPIKGISKAMQAKLRQLKIYDIPTLLQKGRTDAQRKTLSTKLNVDIKLVNSWAKQASLWRVEGMNPDVAYLLVQAGIRHASDLSRVDVEKIYPFLEKLALAQPDFELTSKENIAILIENADQLSGGDTFLSANINGYKRRVERIRNEKITPLLKLNDFSKRDKEIAKFLDEIVSKYENLQSVINARIDKLSLDIEIKESAPTFLFRDAEESEIDTIVSKYNGTEIYTGLTKLKEINYALPLPLTVSGTVYRKSKYDNEGKKEPFSGVRVEIGGIVSPSADKSEADDNPSCLTDSNGKFIIVMPDRYSIKETIIITISQRSNKQVFLKSASEFINSVPEQKLLSTFIELDNEERELNELNVDLKKLKSAEQTAEIKDTINVIKEKINGNEENPEGLEVSYTKKKKRLFTSLHYPTAATLDEAFSHFLSKIDKLDASLEGTNLNEDENEGFVIIDEVFQGEDTNIAKSLPSVKLMGNEGNEIRLSTDMAPSRVFSYGMLQRLVEPAITTPAYNKQVKRDTLSSPLDVMDFKEKLCVNPDEYPQMSSLGIGYVLNMHQAWVPDGFSLGSLLYSLVLAPGEEQRIVVRENKQSYAITDTAEGTDNDSENYSLSQEDDTTAAFNYAVDQLSKANSNSSYSTKTTSVGGSASGGFGGAILGLSAGYSKSSGKASSSASQSNSHNEASSAAQNFQHNIKSAADKISQSKRISVSSATSEVSDSVATKIIANHNHSHAMTLQYWEVMRRYRMETCVDGVDLVLFVPLRLVRFLPKNETYSLNEVTKNSFGKSEFNNRYAVLLKYANTLQSSLPYKFRNGLNLITQYAAYPSWKMESMGKNMNSISLSFNINAIETDDLSVSLMLKNGKGSIAGTIGYKRGILRTDIHTTVELEQEIKRMRNMAPSCKVDCSFTIPADILEEDVAYIRLDYSSESLSYPLNNSLNQLDESQREAYDNMCGKWEDFCQDDDSSSKDMRRIRHYKEALPEAFQNFPYKKIVTLSPSRLRRLGAPTIAEISLKFGEKPITAYASSNVLYSSVSIMISNSERTMRYREFQEMEMTFHHIVSETMHYSQVVWANLSADERAMMLERYTINMNFSKIGESVSFADDEKVTMDGDVDIPLLNCVDVKKMMGFYGNCMLLPFTYPNELAQKLGKTAREIQDALYRYHTNSFRVPTTTISLPTNGMVGEAVLGETNVSEKIDLTRFWNWQDSPIDKMDIDSSYLNGTDYLAGKSTKDITALNLPGASAATPVTAADLVTALVNKQTPTFENITGLDQLKDILNNATTTTAAGRDNVIKESSSLAQAALSSATSLKKAEIEKANAKQATAENNQGNNPNTEDENKQDSSKNTEEDNDQDSNPNTEDENNQSSSQNTDDNDVSSMNKLDNLIKDAQTMEAAALYEKYLGEEYDKEKVEKKAREVCGNDYEEIIALFSLLCNNFDSKNDKNDK